MTVTKNVKYFPVPVGSKSTCAAMALSNSPCKKDSTRGNGMQKGANFFTTLFLFYHTFDWLNQQNLPKLPAAVYLFILN